MFFAYLVQEFLQFLFTHYFLFLSGLVLSIIYRLFNLIWLIVLCEAKRNERFAQYRFVSFRFAKYHKPNLLESRDSSSSYNQPLQKSRSSAFRNLLWTDKHQVLVRFKRTPKSRYFGVHQGPKGLHKRCIITLLFRVQNKCTLLLLFPSESMMMNDYLGFFSSMRNGFVTLNWKPVDR